MTNYFARTVNDIKCLFSHSKTSASDSDIKHSKIRGFMALLGLLIAIIQLGLLVTFSLKLHSLELLPAKHMAILMLILSIILLYCVLSQFGSMHALGKIISVLACGVLTLGIIAFSKLDSTLDNITQVHTQTNTVNVIVPVDSSCTSVKDLSKEYVGINTITDYSVIDKAVRKLNNEYDSEIKTHAYNTWEILLTALYENTDIKAAVMTNAIYEALCEQHPELAKNTKIIHTISIETAITIEPNNNKDNADKNITDTSFVAYLSGNDTTGSITDTGRSDVNILAVVNPKTKHILLVSTPRDYFITIYNNDGKSGLDKLTHAGNYGTNASIQALENLYKTEIDYYCKVNFTGCIDIIDALGGITINSEVEFTTSGENVATKYHFIKGKNYCDGTKALAFVRERNAFASGDFQRGRNQQAAISAIIDKATSASILANYASVLDAVSKMVATNMPTSAMTDLIRAQIANPTPWTVDTFDVTALDMDVKRDCTLSGLKNVNVVIPDYNSVNEAIKRINSTLNE